MSTRIPYHTYVVIAALFCTASFSSIARAACPENPSPANIQTTLAKILANAGNDWDKVGWEFFIALNQPVATGSTTLVWETMRETTDVFLPNGATPNGWAVPPKTPQSVCDKAAKIQGMDMARPFHNFDSVFQADGLQLLDNPAALNPLASAARPPTAVQLQMLMDGVTLGYILEKSLYNMNGVSAFAQAGQPASFPANALEFKASAIWIGNDSKLMNNLQKTYEIINAYYEIHDTSGRPVLGPDGQPTYAVGWAALTGFHISIKPVTNPAWVWITFENMSNGTYTMASLQVPIPDAAKTYNTEYQKQLGTSALAQYQLDGSQVAFTENGKPTILANSQIESAFQHSSSCITCHGTSSYSAEKGWYNFVQMGEGGITYPVGQLPSMAGYTSMDYVWSIRRAQWKR